MKRKLSLLAIALFAAGILAGCEPAPSTPLAPDQKLPDTSKMTPEEISKMHSEASAGGSDRQVQPSNGGGAPEGHGDTPADRQLGRG